MVVVPFMMAATDEHDSSSEKKGKHVRAARRRGNGNQISLICARARTRVIRGLPVLEKHVGCRGGRTGGVLRACESSVAVHSSLG